MTAPLDGGSPEAATLSDPVGRRRCRRRSCPSRIFAAGFPIRVRSCTHLSGERTARTHLPGRRRGRVHAAGRQPRRLAVGGIGRAERARAVARARLRRRERPGRRAVADDALPVAGVPAVPGTAPAPAGALAEGTAPADAPPPAEPGRRRTPLLRRSPGCRRPSLPRRSPGRRRRPPPRPTLARARAPPAIDPEPEHRPPDRPPRRPRRHRAARPRATEVHDHGRRTAWPPSCASPSPRSASPTCSAPPGPTRSTAPGLTLAAYRTIGIVAAARLHHPGLLRTRPSTAGENPSGPATSCCSVAATRCIDLGHVGLAVSATEWVVAPHAGARVRVGPIPTGSIQVVRRLVG